MKTHVYSHCKVHCATEYTDHNDICLSYDSSHNSLLWGLSFENSLDESKVWNQRLRSDFVNSCAGCC